VERAALVGLPFFSLKKLSTFAEGTESERNVEECVL
jgi:hypothetical protein